MALGSRKLIPTCERGRLEKVLFFLIIQHFTPLLSPPSAPSFKNLVLNRYQPSYNTYASGSVSRICQPTVSEVSDEMTS